MGGAQDPGRQGPARQVRAKKVTQQHTFSSHRPGIFLSRLPIPPQPHRGRVHKSTTPLTTTTTTPHHPAHTNTHPPSLSCTAVRIPTLRAHSEAITIETEKPVTPDKARCVHYYGPALWAL